MADQQASEERIHHQKQQAVLPATTVSSTSGKTDDEENNNSKPKSTVNDNDDPNQTKPEEVEKKNDKKNKTITTITFDTTSSLGTTIETAVTVLETSAPSAPQVLSHLRGFAKNDADATQIVKSDFLIQAIVSKVEQSVPDPKSDPAAAECFMLLGDLFAGADVAMTAIINACPDFIESILMRIIEAGGSSTTSANFESKKEALWMASNLFSSSSHDIIIAAADAGVLCAAANTISNFGAEVHLHGAATEEARKLAMEAMWCIANFTSSTEPKEIDTQIVESGIFGIILHNLPDFDSDDSIIETICLEAINFVLSAGSMVNRSEFYKRVVREMRNGEVLTFIDNIAMYKPGARDMGESIMAEFFSDEAADDNQQEAYAAENAQDFYDQASVIQQQPDGTTNHTTEAAAAAAIARQRAVSDAPASVAEEDE